MDWTRAIDRNRAALKQVLAGLMAMAGVAMGQSPPLRGRCPTGQRGVHPAVARDCRLPTAHCRPFPKTLPRRLHRAILRLLRPAEAALRRLVIIAARGLEVTLAPPGPHRRSARSGQGGERGFCLFDKLPRPFRPRPPAFRPRICVPGVTARAPLPPAPTPFDPIDATPLARRLAVLSAVLDDLPKHAERFARWQARLAAPQPIPPRRRRRRAPSTRINPLRPGRPPGHRPRGARGPAEPVHELLAELQGLAVWAMRPADTS